MIYKTEKKYIITRLRHFIFPKSLYHEFFARDNGFDYQSQVIESGILIEGKAFIITCKNKNHLQRREYLQSLPIQALKARQAESLYNYGYVKAGD